MEIKDFTEPKLALEDFKLEELKSGLKIPLKSAAQLAAGEIILSEEPSEDAYRELRDSLMTTEGRENYLKERELKRTNMINAYRSDVGEVLADPEVSMADKSAYLKFLETAETDYKPSTLKTIAEEASVAPSEPDETEHESNVRLEAIDMIDEVHDYKRGMTSRVNALAASRDSNLAGKAWDLAELMAPFSEWISADRIYREFSEDGYGKDGAWLMGSQKQAIQQALRNMPYNERGEFAEKLIEYVQEHDTVILPDGNDLFAIDFLQSIVAKGDYSNTQKWVDNAFSIIDVLAPFAAMAGMSKGAKAPPSVGSIAVRDVRTEVPLTSPSQIVKDVNPAKARAMHEAVVADETGEVAEALYGTTTEEALAKDIAPEPGLNPGEIEYKTSLSKPQYDEPEHIKALRLQDGKEYLTEAEEARATALVVEDLSKPEGFKLHPESTTIRTNEDGSMGIDMIFYPRDAGYKTAAEALDRAKFAFRKYGLGDEHLTLYRRSGDKWIETTQKLLEARAELRARYIKQKRKIPAQLKDIDYAVGLKYNYRFAPEDLDEYDLLTTGRIFGVIPMNLPDRLSISPMASSGQGSVVQNLIPASDLLDVKLTRPAGAAFDMAVTFRKLYVDNFKGFIKGYSKLPKDRREVMAKYIHKANLEGIKFNETDLYARGFNSQEVEILREFRKSNDALFHATNSDMATTLRNKGFMIFKDEATDTRLIAKPIKQGGVSSKINYYDQSTGKIVRAGNKEEIDDFYKSGGTFAKLSEPIEVDGEWIDVIKSDERAGGSYLRAIREGDQVLHYREGYYPVSYDANFFVYRTIRKPDGSTFQKVVASSKTRGEADKMVEILRKKFPEEVIDHRPDRRLEQDRASSFDEAGWSLGINSGMSNQKIRGKRLADAAEGVDEVGHTNLLDPLEAVNMQISTLSKRIATRNYLDTSKKRWIENYAESLKLEKDKFGNWRWPSSVKQIKGKSGVKDQVVADARSAFNYIYSLENGYINGIDEIWKGALNAGANVMADMGLTWIEKGFREVAKKSLTSTFKGAVFKMFLAGNPQRQLVIQAHQTVQLGAINPTYTFGSGMATDLYRLNRAMRGYTEDKEAVTMLKELTNSGMLDAVDANNLIRQDTMRLADLSNWQKAGTIAGKPLKYAQILGFDTAERFVLVTSWLAHRDLALKEGKKLTRRTYDELRGNARAFTYAMNEAGDMPYNQNSFNIIAQFLQVPHKALLQPFTNRNLKPRQRLQLLTWNGVMYGMPAGIAGSMFVDMEDGALKEALESGAEQVILNKVFSVATGEEQNVDWGDLVPTDLHGTNEFLLGLFTLDFGKMVAESPAGSLIFGGNPRLTNFYQTATRWAHLRDDYDDPNLDTKFTDVAISAMNLFSGFSNGFKARYAYKTGTKLSSLGHLKDADVTKFEAAAQFFGFRTETEEDTRKLLEKLHGDKDYSGFDGDVKIWYTELKKHMTRRGMSIKERDMAQRVVTEGLRVFEDSPYKFRESLFNLIKNDVEKNQFNIFEEVIKQGGWVDTNEYKQLINLLPEGEERDILLRSVDRLGE